MARIRLTSTGGKLTDPTITTTTNVLTSPQFAALPVIAPPDYIVLTLDPYAIYGAPEIVTVIGHTANATTVGVTRHQDGTTALPSRTSRPHNQSGTQEDWINAPTDLDFVHASLAGLSADDHPQYYNATRHALAGAHSSPVIASDIFTPGMSMLWSWTAATVPAGWVVANNATVSRVTYATLFALYGTYFGIGDGTSATFSLPNANDVFLYGAQSDGELGAGSIAKTHTHAISVTNTGADAGSGHVHKFASGVNTLNDVTAHSHISVVTGSAGTGVQAGPHQHDMSNITTGGAGTGTAGTNTMGTHNHAASGSSDNGTLTIGTLRFYVILKY